MKYLIGMILISIGSIAEAGERINRRQQRQAERIEEGVQSGELNKNEQRRLNRSEEHISNVEAKAASDGEISKEENLKINRLLKVQSRHIRHQKHDRHQIK